MSDDDGTDSYNVPGNWNDSSPLAASGITPTSTRQQVGREIQGLGSDEQAVAQAMAAKSAALKDVLTQAAQTLRNTPVGPSSGERWQSMMGAWLSAPGVAGAGRMAQSVADSMAAQREAELAKQQLLANYDLSAAQYQTVSANNSANTGGDSASSPAADAQSMRSQLLAI